MYPLHQEFINWGLLHVVESTRRTYSDSLNRISKYLKIPIDFTEIKIENFKQSLLKMRLSPSTINVTLAVLGTLCREAHRRGDLTIIPKISYLKIRNGKDRFLSEDEIKLILESAKNPLRLMILVGLSTGIRKEGIFQLKWSEISNGILDIISKGGKRIAVPIPETLQNAIESYKTKQFFLGITSEYVFPSPSYLSKPRHRCGDAGLKVLLKKLGIEGVTWHTFRHTFATHFLKGNGNLRLLQDLLGHSNISQTSRYAHVIMDDKIKAIQEYSKGLPA